MSHNTIKNITKVLFLVKPESSIRTQLSGVHPVPFSLDSPTYPILPVQEEMARVKQTARVSEEDGTIRVPAGSIREVESSAQQVSSDDEVQLEEEEEDLLLVEDDEEVHEGEDVTPSTYKGRKPTELPTPQSVLIRDEFVDNVDKDKLERELIRGQGPKGEEFNLVIPSKGNVVTDAPEGCFAVYT